MIPQVFGCQNCGNPVCLSEGQFIVQCPYCREKFYYPNPTLPVVALKPRIKVNEAKQLILKALRAKEIDPFFLSHSYFEKATLFFIPFFEVRGIRAGKMKKDKTIPRPNAGPKPVHPTSTPEPGIERNRESEFICNSFQYLERANDIRDLGIGFIDISLVEDTILNSEQMEFNPTEMRKVGVLLPVTSNRPAQQESELPALPIIEFYVRVLYFPVWEIGYSYEGILFKSYLEGMNGGIMKIQAIKNGKRNLLTALLGAFALGTLISRSLIFGFQTVVIAPLILVTLVLASGTAFLMFFPYFWQLFAFKEIIEKRPKIIDSYPINYSENRFIRFANRLLARIIRFLGMAQKNVSAD
jgi:hypothetical protein